MGGQLVDLRQQVEADAERARDDAGAVKQQVPGRDRLTGDREGAFVQVGNGQVRFVARSDGLTRSKARAAQRNGFRLFIVTDTPLVDLFEQHYVRRRP